MISEVGYLHDNPEIEALLKRKGIHSIDANDLVQLLDLALSSSAETAIPGIHHLTDALASAHLPTGLEELRRMGFDGNNPTLDDPRPALLAHALVGEGDADRAAQEGRYPVPVAKPQGRANARRGGSQFHSTSVWALSAYQVRCCGRREAP